MTTSRTSSQRRVGRPLKSPLAVAADYGLAESAGEPEARTAGGGAAQSDRGITLAEFEEYLRTTNNRDGRPYEDRTIQAYVFPGKNLDAWMTTQRIEGDFTVADTGLLNRYFREYYLERGQGGTHTLQRNLIQLFNFLARERDHPTPYTEGLNRYAEVKGRPKTLGPSSSTTSWKSLAAGRRGTSTTPATTPSSGSCAARASGGPSCWAWSCTHCRPT